MDTHIIQFFVNFFVVIAAINTNLLNIKLVFAKLVSNPIYIWLKVFCVRRCYVNICNDSAFAIYALMIQIMKPTRLSRALEYPAI